jgi:hypothetical protein
MHETTMANANPAAWGLNAPALRIDAWLITLSLLVTMIPANGLARRPTWSSHAASTMQKPARRFFGTKIFTAPILHSAH